MTRARFRGRVKLAGVAVVVVLLAPLAASAPAPKATFHLDGLLAHTRCASSYEVAIYGDSTDGGLWRFFVLITRGATAPCGPWASLTSYVGEFDYRGWSCLVPVEDDGSLCLKPIGPDVAPLPTVEAGAWRVDVCAVGECYRGDARGGGFLDGVSAPSVTPDVGAFADRR